MTTKNDDEQKMLKQLETAIRWKKHSPEATRSIEFWDISHALAEAQYQPAIDFFVEGLSDPDWDWREKCLEFIGFHYDIPPDSEIINKIRELLTSDPYPSVRMTAASVIGNLSTLPDQALVNAVNSDTDWFVRRSAYLALLELAGVSYDVYVREYERFDSDLEEPNPDLHEINRILTEEGIEVPPNTFGSIYPDE